MSVITLWPMRYSLVHHLGRHLTRKFEFVLHTYILYKANCSSEKRLFLGAPTINSDLELG